MERQGYQILKPNQCGKVIYDLYPKDILYLPPGFYHVAETNEEPSLHFTLTLEPLSFWSEIHKHFFKTLLSDCANMNKDIRMLSSNDARQHFDDCIRKLRDSLPPELGEDLLRARDNTD
jgi:ribosomal protein L16 Arg81 hydroxylase